MQVASLIASWWAVKQPSRHAAESERGRWSMRRQSVFGGAALADRQRRMTVLYRAAPWTQALWCRAIRSCGSPSSPRERTSIFTSLNVVPVQSASARPMYLLRHGVNGYNGRSKPRCRSDAKSPAWP